LGAKFAEDKYPGPLIAMRNAERLYGIHPGEEHMGGDEGVTCTLDQSGDLGNESHFDPMDASQSFSIWTEKIKDSAGNWYFVMPNVQVFHGGKVYYGVAVRLRHGTSVSWDGRVIRHCTSVTEVGMGNHVFGTFWGAKSKQVKVNLSNIVEDENE
jgi:hypothetical protein